METRQLSVVRKPAEGTRTVFVVDVAPVIKGQGDVSYTCGGCRTLLIDSVDAGQVVNVVICCPACGAHNETLD